MLSELARCYIIEDITNETFAAALEEHLLEPLSLHHTFASTPKNLSQGIVLHNAIFSGWDIDISEATADGGIFASASDLSVRGCSILSSTLLSPIPPAPGSSPQRSHPVPSAPSAVPGRSTAPFRTKQKTA
ncbi:hypothetical protein PMIN03_002299 [Paraphaeosphaeria minitans]